MKFEKLNILVEMTFLSVFILLNCPKVSACMKGQSKRRSSVTDATTTKRGLDEDYSKCEGDQGSFNMTAATLGKITLSVRPPCVISLKIEQLGEAAGKHRQSCNRPEVMTAAHSFPPVLLYADFETRNNESGISYPNLSITCWNAKNSRFREITLLDHVVSLKIIAIGVVRGLTVHWKAVENGMLI